MGAACLGVADAFLGVEASCLGEEVSFEGPQVDVVQGGPSGEAA